jgi:TM2 domain-containing membrane protein YozV
MDCVNHSGVGATAYCQNCGKALCAACTRKAVGGQIFCEPCSTAWQSYQQPYRPPFVPPPASGPNPSAAAVLGLIPGVGAMYNGQFLKGFIHVMVFAVLISLASSVNGIFGIFIGAWVIYQSFEAYHTARALRDGLPLPDPFGLNDVGNWLNQGVRPMNPDQGSGFYPAAGAPAETRSEAGQASTGAAPAGYQPPVAGQAQTPYPYPYPPPMPPPNFCRRQEPIGAIVLIGLGVLFLLGQLDIFHGHFTEFAWPLMLIALGVWLIVRRISDSQGGSK